MKKQKILMAVLGIIGIVLITAGVTYAFFSYTRQGTTDNTIETGTITFIYEEVEKQGAGISIEDAYPMSDDKGIAQSGSGKVFNFKVKSTTMSTTSIPYTVTARMKSGSTLDQDVVKIYLTDVVGDAETKILLNTFDQLPQTTVEVPENTVEKVIYTGEVPAKSTNYEKNFRLRMWIKEGTDFSGVEQADGTIVYPYNDKEFSITVNVYANAELITVPEETVAYYAFGLPTTASSTNFLDVITESGSKSFVKLEGDQLSTCIYRNETLECFKSNNYEEESQRLINLFGEDTCTFDSSFVDCRVEGFSGRIVTDGTVVSHDSAAGTYCFVYSDGSVNCF